MTKYINLIRRDRSSKDFASLKRIAPLVCAAVFIAPFAQASSPALLRIKNLSNEQQTFVVNAAQNCMDGIVAGAKIEVGPYSSVDQTFYKNDGSCSGDMGIFGITPVIEGVENPDYIAFTLMAKAESRRKVKYLIIQVGSTMRVIETPALIAA
jgi:hypothetical protein